MKRIFAGCLVAFLLFSCKKEKANPPKPITSLKITVNSETSGRPVPSGVSVSLYASLSDWENKTNAVGTKSTDDNGTVTFSDLSPMKYYFFVSTDCFNNGYNKMATAGAIIKDVVNSETTEIGQAGKLIFNNNSTDLYRIYVNGVALVELAGGLSYSIPYRPAGFYTIRVLQLNGYIINPTDQTYTGTLVCGGALQTSFP